MHRFFVLSIILAAPALLGAQGVRQTSTGAVVTAPVTTLPLKREPRPTGAAISATDLMTRLYIFADDSMLGRETGTIGSVRSTDYLARELARLGLVPAGDSGSFFQTLPFKTRAVDPASRLIVAGTPLLLGVEWGASATRSASAPEAAVVYGGVIGDSASLIPPAQAAGKLVVYRISPSGSIYRSIRSATRLAPGAAAVAVIVAEQVIGLYQRPSTFLDDPDAAARPATPLLVIAPASAAKLFDAPIDQLRAGTAGKPASLELRMRIEPVPFPARNVVAVVPGSDPVLRNQYVAIGAHSDHVGANAPPVDHDSLRLFNRIVRPGGAEDGGKQPTAAQQTEVNRQLAAWRAAHPGAGRRDSISNGADDDGSGSVAALEISERMSALPVKPKRSILFVWHVGEEKGLLGAAYFADHATVPRDSIVAQLNLDMVGRGNASDVTGESRDGALLRGGPGYLQLVGSRRLSRELGDLVERANTEGKHGFVFDYSMDANGHPMNIYCRSDHYEYARYGIPITFFTTGGHSDYHQVTDEPQYVDYERLAGVARLVDDVAQRIANLDHRIALDGPKPDPRGSCRQ
jgi:hypothetical protein